MILFLDDDPDLGNLIEKKFSNFGEEVHVYRSIKKLKDSGRLEKASILCFDINLHPENGIEFLKSISPLYPNLSYVCFSNYSDLLEDQLHSAGVDNYVCKDDGIEELVVMISRILEERIILGLKVG